MTEQQYLTVSALTKYIKRKFEADPYLGRVYLTGEISNFRKRPMHQYFSLKDDHAKISAVMFKSAFDKVKFEPTEGMKVLVVGYVSVYEATGAYQINIERMEPDGIGALYQAFEQLKEKLAKEGLFTAPKKAIPRFPKRIAVLTSPSGAVIRDIITTVRRRYPIAQIILYPTVVQGDQAARNIVENLKRADQQNFDTIIIGRGGGSIEDLWPFNEEVVARQIFATNTPIISSVGHETDTTIADYVADMRAPTPTAAAELAVPVLTEEVLKINQQQMRLVQAFQAQLQKKTHQLDRLLQSYIFTQPQRLYEAKVLQLDHLQQQLNIQLQSMLREKEKAYQFIAQRLNQQTPIYRLQAEGQKLDYLYERLNQATNRIYQQKLQTFQHLVASLDLLSPLKIMQRGYSYTTSEEKVVKSVKQLAVNQLLTIHYADGKVQSKVEKIQEDK
ncbi:exodeoxyribonuclease VII large subunit [Enterococcus columbae]|uniref:Exodeoxyribonuclease 7 large subunit n=1 Tax=Enterococcus columbae DSM 7374 = ATCC 51263 TaxID=1121865 RepID=S1N4Q4_9ENTE|nr:exodeoxyribonuclease VII large subunit [Enterococcus columbae]EOT42051.1 exodeoxyribonuclease VII, large subunit [Enterococcus columbae DSM 7374 = ATCC 51263]EOW80608.1 exodeoxyribonuclease VII, large subunit [Enterococcus columbae DSM 7374 = ATCC 51263]OJG26315.1 exodeoxyribonuclease VII, large subunit [Enterococcus columbae DSM 7374 = ATCC 51263]